MENTSESASSKTLEQQFAELQNEVKELHKKVAINLTRVSWEDKVSESGIQLSGGSTIIRKGTVIGSFGVPIGPTQMAVLLVLKRDSDNQVIVMNVAETKILAE